MRILKPRSGIPGRQGTDASAVFGAWGAATAILLATPALAPGQSDFDIAVTDIAVSETVNNAPVASGKPGNKYLVACSFKSGPSTPSSVPFRLLVNGYAVQDVSVPMLPQMPFSVATMAWTPVMPASYTLACEANPSHVIPETIFTNNKKAIQFAVLDPSVAYQAGDLMPMPAQRGQVSTNVTKEAATRPKPAGLRDEGGKGLETDVDAKAVHEEAKPQPQIDPTIVAKANAAILPSEPPGPPDLVVIAEGPKFRVKNQGGTTSPMVGLRWSCSTYGSVPLGPCSWFGENGVSADLLPSLDPGEEWVRYLENESTTQACPANNFIVMCKFTLAVDPSNQLTEIAETNNTGSYNKLAY